MHVITDSELKILCNTTVQLTALRQKYCEHLAVENFASETLQKLLNVLQIHKIHYEKASKD